MRRLTSASGIFDIALLVRSSYKLWESHTHKCPESFRWQRNFGPVSRRGRILHTWGFGAAETLMHATWRAQAPASHMTTYQHPPLLCVAQRDCGVLFQ